MNYEPKWTWRTLRWHALAYLGEERLPRGSRPVLHSFLGRTAYPEALYRALRQFRKWPNLP
jgi:hypothetical protein